MKSKERDKSILYVQCMYNNVHTCKVPEIERPHNTYKRLDFGRVELNTATDITVYTIKHRG